MVNTSLLVAIIGVGGTIIASGIGAYVNIRNTRERIKQENTRTGAEFYIEEKFNQLLDFYKTNNTFKTEFASRVVDDRNRHIGEDHWRTGPGLTSENIDDVLSSYQDWTTKSDECMIFLDEEQKGLVQKSRVVHQVIVEEIEQNEGEPEIDWDIVEQRQAIQQLDLELDRFKLHSRLVGEMLESELNKYVEYLDMKSKSNDTEGWREECREKYPEQNFISIPDDEETL